MNNGEREIDDLLTEMEKEVTNLKTAHQRPLGALNFFKKSEQFTIPLQSLAGTYIANFNLIVKIATPTTTPPIVQAGWDTPANFFRVERTEMAISADYSTYTYKLRLQTQTSLVSAIFKAQAISSQPIQSITVEVL